MREHVCKEYIVWEGDMNEEGFVVCNDCRRSPTPEEIIRLLRATEMLSAKDARRVGVEIEQGTYDLRGLKPDGFLAYANILETK